VSVKVFACGDFLNSISNKDFADKQLTELIKSADLSICNFESPIASKDGRPIKKAGPHVCQSRESVKFLSNTGFDMVSIANNHIYDYGQSAIEDTIREFKKYNVGFVGGGNSFEEAYKPRIVQVKGIKIGLLAGCENEFGCLYEEEDRGGYAWLLHEIIEDNIRRLKHETDVVILIAHAGVEEIDFPIKEWRSIYRRFCDAGADVIIGHHPHVPQGYERHKDSIIFYSLGNFYFDTASFQYRSDDSYSVLLEFNQNGFSEFDVIYHRKIGGQTCLIRREEATFDLDYLNSLLGVGYEKRNDKMSIALLNKYYYSYYQASLGVPPSNSSLIHKVKYFVKKWFSGKSQTDRNLLLLHNIKIESHRFVVQRALHLLTVENKE